MIEQKAPIPEDLETWYAVACDGVEFKTGHTAIKTLIERIAKLEADLLNAHAIARGVTHHDTCCESSEKYKALLAENERLTETNKRLNRRVGTLEHAVNTQSEKGAWYRYFMCGLDLYQRAQEECKTLKEENERLKAPLSVTVEKRNVQQLNDKGPFDVVEYPAPKKGARAMADKAPIPKEFTEEYEQAKECVESKDCMTCRGTMNKIERTAKLAGENKALLEALRAPTTDRELKEYGRRLSQLQDQDGADMNYRNAHKQAVKEMLDARAAIAQAKETK